MLVQQILSDRFPEALGAVLGGSAAHGESTASSDLDMVVLLSGPPAPMRVTERLRGRPVEFFVHTEESLVDFLGRERRLRRSPLLHMLATGTIVSDPFGRIAPLQELARRRWEAGPDVVDAAELEDRRYRLTALLDDLADTPDPGERAAITASVFTDLADLMLVSRTCWTGSGRWLLRRLHQVDPDLAQRLVAGFERAVGGDPGLLLALGNAELARLGGRLDEGYERRA
ncbi:nucleotidyltransferase domain-containing protein [Actinomycetospora sp. CA-084318]|uniref:nucleotidyltransferase domain-containing protein n=1 Tax=Actinomycetospora sp. CA-084318 TaxID=3239892 RepID=UPI003D9605D2